MTLFEGVCVSIRSQGTRVSKHVSMFFSATLRIKVIWFPDLCKQQHPLGLLQIPKIHHHQKRPHEPTLTSGINKNNHNTDYKTAAAATPTTTAMRITTMTMTKQ